MANARFAALKALEKCRRAGAWSDAVLGSVMDAEGLESRDRALASALCYGVMQNMLLLDSYIDSYSSIKAAKLEPKVLDILRISAYQLAFMDRIPASAAVNEAVKLCRKLGFARASGLVNAVLRRISENSGKLPEPQGGDVLQLSVKYSHPLWLAQYLVDRFGAFEARQLMECNNSKPLITLQTNTTKTDTASLIHSLNAGGAKVKAHPYLPDCLLLSDSGAVSAFSEFKDGLFYVQDAAAKMTVMAAGPKAGDKILDCCAAPGGKSFAAAVISRGEAEIISCDIHENKLKRIRESAERLGFNCIVAMARDGRNFLPAWKQSFDIVIADVPCSGLGVIRKKPDIRYKSPEEFGALPGIQLDILKNVSEYVKPGGCLVYSTCTIRSEENFGVIESFLEENRFFTAEEFQLPGGISSQKGMLQLLPHRHGTDGFFITKLRRIK